LKKKYTTHFLFFIIILLFANFNSAQSQVWIEDSTNYIPPYPSIGWDSLESIINYPRITKRISIQQSATINVFIKSDGQIDSIDYRDMYPIFVQSVDSAMYSTEWIPGKLEGIAVDTSINLPINFKLYDNKNAPPLTIILERNQSRGHWEYLPVLIDTTCVSIPDERPENFSFIFKQWFYTDSLYLDTNQKFLRYIYGDVDTSLTFSLSRNALDSIYTIMQKIHFLCYPKDFRPGTTGWISHSFSYYCKMVVNDFENEISLDSGWLSNDPSYKKLREFFLMINSVIHNSVDFKKIPKPTMLNMY
jgi:hypothetical protein